MKISAVINHLESLAPKSMQESYDNSGLIAGDPSVELTRALISLDCTEDIVKEAIEQKCNLIIAHHPIIFKGLKSLTGKNYVERTIILAIKNDIAIYAIHTNLDNYKFGVNYKIGQILDIENPQILVPTSGSLSKLSVYVPLSHEQKIMDCLFKAGAGEIGHYSECSFRAQGMGTYKANKKAKPFLGEVNTQHSEKEIKLEVLVSNHILKRLVTSMLKVHPYEEVAYDLYPIKNVNNDEGAGMWGELNDEVDTATFLNLLKQRFHCQTIRHTTIHKSKIKRIAWCGGSGSFLLEDAKHVKADIFITGDFKYHDFFDADNQIIIADIGHFESEQFTVNLIDELLAKKFTNFDPYLSNINTNPIKYL